MWEDPIVKEVRQAGEELAKKYNYNLHSFLAGMRKAEKERKSKVVSNTDIKKEVLKK